MILGVGLEPGTPCEHVTEVLHALGVTAVTAVTVVATIDTRRGEPAIGELAVGRTLRCYPVHDLAAVDVPNPSAVVRRLTGTGSVAEAAAILAARELGAGELVVAKQRGRGVTVAIAR